ncbi:MAG: SDR family oxidoreductase [Gemmatimonadetes bacterium]|nr:SDR family oxidoreductase [Gemmatimonadota bacterium]
MDLGLSGRVALVGASSKGLGRAIAERLAAEGADLVLCARTEATLREVRDRIAASSGRTVIAVPADLSRSEDAERVVATALAELGRIDVLVTNTGGPPPGRFEAHAPAAWEQAVRQLLFSVLALVRGVLPGMKERRWGRILNVTSIAVKEPVENLILSNSVRAAVTGFARTLANEVGGEGITVNNLMPGYFGTDRIHTLAQATATRDGVSAEEVLARYAARVPVGRVGDPPEFGAVAAFLVSEHASYITGQSIAVDGGRAGGLL